MSPASVKILPFYLFIIFMKRLLSAIVLSCCVAFAHAEGYETGVEAYRAGDYARALKIFQELSARGYGDGDWMLSIMYANGAAVMQDSKKSEEYAMRAAERGVENAYTLVAILHLSKKSDRFDPAKGVAWLQKGVKAHNPESLRILALHKSKGKYMPQDKEGAFRLMKECMELNDALCAMGLAEMYAKGTGTPQSYTKAFRLYKSVRDDAGEANYMLGRMSEAGQGTDKDFGLAMEYYLSAAKKQNGGAMNRIGELYLRGQGVARDYAQAAYWFEKAADFQNSDGLVNGGHLYAQGLGVKRDDAEAVKWYQEAAEKGNSDAMRALARFHEEGRGVAASSSNASQLFCNAALNDQPRMLEELAEANLEAAARKNIIGELAVLYHCKNKSEAREAASALETRLTAAERDAAQALAGNFKDGGIGKALDSFAPSSL